MGSIAGKISEMEFRLIDSKEKQALAEGDLKDLFLEAFRRPISDNQWRHYYMDCPAGQTVSFAYYHEGVMLAHGGLIPQQLISLDGKRSYYLQTAIMVRKEYQTLFLFKDLLDKMGEYVVSRKSFAVAFPNNNTYLPFVKMLGWRMVREYMIEQYEYKTGSIANNTAERRPADYSFKYELYRDDSFMKWRSSLNGAKILKTGGHEIVYKDYEGSMEILDIVAAKHSALVDMSDIMKGLSYDRVNIAGCFDYYVSFRGLVSKGTVGIPQRMCFYPAQYEQCRYEEIRPSLLISDVF